MKGIVAEICRDLLLRSSEAANSPRMHSPPALTNRLPMLAYYDEMLANRLPTAAGAPSGRL